MSNAINRFIDRVRAAESRNQKEVVLTLQESRDLHNDITRLLLKIESLSVESTQPITVQIAPNDF